MKQRFSAAGNIPLWVTSSLEGLKNAGFSQINLEDNNKITSKIQSRPFTVIISDRSPGQITLDLTGAENQDFDRYKYNVAKVLQQKLKAGVTEEDAKKELSEYRTRQKAEEEKEAAEKEKVKKSVQSKPDREKQADTIFDEVQEANKAEAEIPDFSELQSGVTTPLPIMDILQTEEAIAREKKARELLDNSALEQKAAEQNTAKPKEAEDQEQEQNPEQNSEEGKEQKETEVSEDTVSVESPKGEETVVVEDETTQLKDESAPSTPQEKINSIMDDSYDYDHLKPIENPSNAGELYNNMLLENVTPEESEKSSPALSKTPWYQHDWFTILLLILVPPVGIYLLWKNKLYNDRVRKFLTIFFVCYTVLWIWLISLLFNPSIRRSGQSGSVTVPASEVVQPDKNALISDYLGIDAVKNYMDQMPGLINDYNANLQDPGIEAGGDQIMTTLQKIEALDDEVLKVGEPSGAETQAIHNQINRTALTFNSAILNLRTAIQNGDVAGRDAALQELQNAENEFNNIQPTIDAQLNS